jgi:hypothetical protein
MGRTTSRRSVVQGAIIRPHHNAHEIDSGAAAGLRRILDRRRAIDP